MIVQQLKKGKYTKFFLFNITVLIPRVRGNMQLGTKL